MNKKDTLCAWQAANHGCKSANMEEQNVKPCASSLP